MSIKFPGCLAGALIVLSLFSIHSSIAQQGDERYYGALEYREIGPFRGGRSAAVTGVPGKPNLFYFGATGGGVWRTQDGGRNWENISDGFFGGSIGSIDVEKPPYAGMFLLVMESGNRRMPGRPGPKAG